MTEMVRQVRERADRFLGGRGRLRVVVVLASALGLAGADIATMAAAAGAVKTALGIGNAGIGLLVSLSSVSAAVATLPIGVLTDRVRRTRLLALSAILWAAAMVVAGLAPGFWVLLAARLMLGAVTATTGPTVASLLGDYFPAAERARIYGIVLGGELVGTGIGFVLSGQIVALLSWRFAFWWLVLPVIPLAIAAWRLPEPQRGGQQALTASPGRSQAERQVRRQGVEPSPSAVPDADPAGRSLWWVLRYVLGVRTNLVIIVASALGYFYFTGLRSFVIIFVTGHYGISVALASALTLVVGVGALAGILAGGRLTDRLLGRGWLNARVVVPAICLLLVPAALAPAILVTVVWVALPLITAGAALLAAANPGMDAARLDVLLPAVWGRGEAVRTAIRTLAEAGAPALFGYLSEFVFTGPDGLMYALLVGLAALLLAGAAALLAKRTYAHDVAAVMTSAQKTA